MFNTATSIRCCMHSSIAMEFSSVSGSLKSCSQGLYREIGWVVAIDRQRYWLDSIFGLSTDSARLHFFFHDWLDRLWLTLTSFYRPSRIALISVLLLWIRHVYYHLMLVFSYENSNHQLSVCYRVRCLLGQVFAGHAPLLSPKASHNERQILIAPNRLARLLGRTSAIYRLTCLICWSMILHHSISTNATYAICSIHPFYHKIRNFKQVQSYKVVLTIQG